MVRVEYTSNGARIKALLQLFANLTVAQWRGLPKVEAEWIHGEGFERSIEHPLEGLAFILVGLIRHSPPSDWRDAQLVALLADISDLIEHWMLALPDAAAALSYGNVVQVFAPPLDQDVDEDGSVQGHRGIVRVLGRLCEMALQLEAMKQVSEEGLKPEDLLTYYSK